MSEIRETYAWPGKDLGEAFWWENDLVPEGLLNAMHNVVSCMEEAEEGGLPVERYPVWNHEFVDKLRKEDSSRMSPRKVELVVPGLVAEEEYHQIMDSAELGNYTIVNPREFPYFPKALWIKVTCLPELHCICPQFPQQIIIVDIDNCMSYDRYEEILFEAVAKNYLVLNPGPFPAYEVLKRDNSLFELEMYKKFEDISRAEIELEKLQANYFAMKFYWSERVEKLWALSEKKGRDRARAEIMARRETTVKSLDARIAFMHARWKEYETMSQDLFNEYKGLTVKAVERDLLLPLEINEEELKVAKAEAALKRLREQLERHQTDVNCEARAVRDTLCSWDGKEMQDLQEKWRWREGLPIFSLPDRTEPGLLSRPAIPKSWMWSPLGISTSLGLSLFAFACICTWSSVQRR